jgi:NADPH:quinone reductase
VLLMRAVGLYRYLPIDDPQSFVAAEVPTPEPTGRDLLVRVHAVSVNPVDVKQRAPKSVVEPNLRILGWDAAGVVAAVGPDVTRFKPGDAVYYAGSIDRPGSNAEYQLVDERIVGPKPASLTFQQAAALPLTTITAWEGLFERLGIAKQATANAERTLLIIGGAGGVGSIAIQLAKRVAGLHVVATASRPDSVRWCQELGADAVIDHGASLPEQLASLGLPAVEYIFCLNSTEQHFRAMADMIAPQGKLCTIVEAKHNQPLDMNLLQRKSATFAWELMFTRPLFQTHDMQAQHELLAEVAELIDNGTLRTTLTSELGPLTPHSLREAHRQIETGRMIGKLALRGIE